MCGIVGVIAKTKGGLFKPQVDMFQQMFLVDQLRGIDGAGIIMNSADGIETLKAPYRAGSFMSGEPFKAAMDVAVKEGHFIIGHNRASTRGENTWPNTHPFTEGPISLVHNGTLFNHKNLDKEVVVDSHAICKHMALHSAKETLKEIDGAFALVWVNEDDMTINMARNKERPLHLIETSICWIISSELGLGLWMAERHKMTVVSSIQLATETLYTFDIHNLSKYTTETVEYFKWSSPNVGHGTWGAGHFDENDGSFFQSRREKHIRERAEKRKAKAANSNVVTFPAIIQKEIIIPTRGFGTRLKFQPAWLTKDVPSSAIVHDKLKEQNFLIGSVAGEPNTEVRVYAKNALLEELVQNDVLEGTVYLTSIHGKRTSYQLTNITVVASEPLSEGVMNEFALTKYCDKNGIANNPNTSMTCDCCSTPILRKEVVMRAGKPLCDTCDTAFSSNKELAKEMGYQ